MKAADRRIDAHLFHPDLGNEMVPGEIAVDRQALHFQSDTMALDVPLERVLIECDSKSGRVLLRDRQQPDVRLFTLDESLFDDPLFTGSRHIRPQLEAILGRRDIWRRVRLTLYAFLACCVLVWIGSFIFKTIVRAVVAEVPAEWEKRFGDAEMVELQKKMNFLDDTNRVAELAQLSAPLVQGIPGPRLELKFHIVDTALPNAAALPGGHVLVTSGLLAMIDRPEQLLGVLAHELAHVKCRHGFQQAISGAGPLLIMQILLSDRNNRLNLLAQISGVLIYTSFSQKFEREADDIGWSYLVAANINPHGMIEALQKLEGRYGDSFVPEALQSHPLLSKRIARLEAKWDALPKKSGFMVITNRVPVPPQIRPGNPFEDLMRRRRQR